MKINNIKKLLFRRQTLFTVLQFIIFLGIFFVILKLTENNAQSLGFQDENGHMMEGSLLNKGFIPYKDFSANHQPLIYIFSSWLQHIFHPNTIFMLVKRHREIIFIFGALWSLISLISFGPIALILFGVFEITKFLFLGNQWLGETFAAYPFMFLVGLTTKTWMKNVYPKKYEIVLAAIAFFVTAFNLLPIWITLFGLEVLLLIYMRKNPKDIALLVGIEAFLTIALFLFIPVADYYKENVYNNTHYFFPASNISSLSSTIQGFFLLFTTFSLKPTIIQLVIMLFTVTAVINTFFAFKLKKLWIWIVLLVLIFFSNNRVYTLQDNTLFAIFHALPWYGGFLVAQVVLTTTMLQSKIYKTYKPYVIASITCMIVALVAVVVYPQSPLRVKKNVNNESFINYSEFVKYGTVINILKKDDDRTLAYPYDSLSLWASNTLPETKIIEYYSWMYTVPDLRKNVEDNLHNKPPAFVIKRPYNETNPFNALVDKLLEKGYSNIWYMGQPSYLYVQTSRFDEITPDQWDKLKFYDFAKPAK